MYHRTRVYPGKPVISMASSLLAIGVPALANALICNCTTDPALVWIVRWKTTDHDQPQWPIVFHWQTQHNVIEQFLLAILQLGYVTFTTMRTRALISPTEACSGVGSWSVILMPRIPGSGKRAQKPWSLLPPNGRVTMLSYTCVHWDIHNTN